MTSRIDTIHDRLTAYVSIPAQPNGHAVIVLQEIFGVTRAIRGIADRFADDGYLAFAPDLFWRAQPGIELSHSKEDMAKAFVLLRNYSDDSGMEDVGSTARHIRSLPGFSGKVVVAGMCLGGMLAYLGAMRDDIDAAVGYYGVGIEKKLDRAAAIRAPLQLHFGDRDPYVPDAARKSIVDALASNPLVEIHEYPGAGHGFYTRGSAEDIALARERTNAFLRPLD